VTGGFHDSTARAILPSVAAALWAMTLISRQNSGVVVGGVAMALLSKRRYLGSPRKNLSSLSLGKVGRCCTVTL
jgi:hypothetical protein